MPKKVVEAGDGDVSEGVDGLNASLYEAFKRFSTRKTLMSSMELKKWFKDAKVLGKHTDNIHLDVCFFKVRKRKTKVMDFKGFLALLNEVLVTYIDDSWLPALQALPHLKHKLANAHPILYCSMTDLTIGAVDRLTDHKNFTGTQKVRFNKLNLSRNSKYDGWLPYNLTEETDTDLPAMPASSLPRKANVE